MILENRYNIFTTFTTMSSISFMFDLTVSTFSAYAIAKPNIFLINYSIINYNPNNSMPI